MRRNARAPVHQIVAEYKPIKDLSIYPVMHRSGIHPDAAFNVQGLEADRDLWARLGYIPQKADLQTAIARRSWQEALRRLDGQR
jgi:hypothetical protein